MNGDPQKRKVLYEALTKDGYALGTLDEFSAKMDDPNKAKALYDGITKDGYEVGDFETFNAKVGSPKPAALSSMTTPLPGAAAGPSIGSGMQQAASQEPSGPPPPTDGRAFSEDFFADQPTNQPAPSVPTMAPNGGRKPVQQAVEEANFFNAVQAEKKNQRIAPLMMESEEGRTALRQLVEDVNLSKSADGIGMTGPRDPGSLSPQVFSQYQKVQFDPTMQVMDPRMDKIHSDFEVLAPKVNQRKTQFSPQERQERIEAGTWQQDPKNELNYQADALQFQGRLLAGRKLKLMEQVQAGADPASLQAEAADIDAGEQYVREKLTELGQRDPRSFADKLREESQAVSDKENSAAGDAARGFVFSAAGTLRSGLAGAARLIDPGDGYTFSDKLSDWASNIDKDRAALRSKENKDSILGKLADGAGSMTAYILGGGTGTPAMVATALTTEYEGFVRQAMDQGATEDQAEAAGLAYAPISAAIELVNPQTYFANRAGMTAVRKTFIDMVKSGAKPKEALKYALDATEGGLREALEELSQTATERATNYAVNQVAGTDLNTSISAKEAGETVLISALLGGAGEVANRAATKGERSRLQAEAMMWAAKNPDQAKSIAAKVNPAEADAFGERLDKLTRTYNGNNLTEQKPKVAARVADLVHEKQDVETAIKEAPMDPSVEAAVGDPRKRKAAELTTAMIEAMGIPADKAKAALIGAGMEKAPEGTKAITNPDGSVTLEKKPETGGAKAPTATASAQPAKKETTSKAVESVFSADEATGEEPTTNEDQLAPEAPAAAQAEDTGDPASVPAPEQPTRVEPVLTQDVPDDRVSLAAAYEQARMEHGNESDPDAVLSALTAGDVSIKSYERWGDKNNVAKGIAKQYLRTKGRDIDEIAQEASGITGQEISPEDVVAFMERFPSGRPQRSPRMVELDQRHGALYGTKLNKLAAKSILAKHKGEIPRFTPQEQAIADEAEQQGVALTELDDQDSEDYDNMTDEEDDIMFGGGPSTTTKFDLNAKRGTEQTQPGGTPEAQGEVRRDEGTGTAQDQERAVLEETLVGARKELEAYERYFKKQAESLFDKDAVESKKRGKVKRAEPSMFEAEGDTRANTAEDMEAGAKTLRDRVALAEKALADYDAQAGVREKAAAAQTTILDKSDQAALEEAAKSITPNKVSTGVLPNDKEYVYGNLSTADGSTSNNIMVVDGAAEELVDGAEIINEMGRWIVRAKLPNGKTFPFYVSNSGTSGKEAGKWYPFFGIAKNGWLIKGTMEQLESEYGIDELSQVSKNLNERLRIPGSFINPVTGAVSDNGKVLMTVGDFGFKHKQRTDPDNHAEINSFLGLPAPPDVSADGKGDAKEWANNVFANAGLQRPAAQQTSIDQAPADNTPISKPEKAMSSASRFRPRKRVEFDTPIKGPSGAVLKAYEWQYEFEEYVDDRGEERVRRVSDWNKAELSDETGRDIVHQFEVVTPDGFGYLVSAESALKLMGYMEANASVKSKMSAAKALAGLLMNRQVLQEEVARRKAVEDEVDALPRPEIIKEDKSENEELRGFGREESKNRINQVWSMGDASIWASFRKDDPYLKMEKEERAKTLGRSWKANRLKERGVKPHENPSAKLREVEKKIATKERQLGAKATDVSQGAPTTGAAEAAARKAAAALEKAKLKPDQLYALPLPPSVWNGAIRAMQEVIIAGGKAVDAIAAAIKHIQASDWWKNKATQKEKDEVTSHLKGKQDALEAAIAAEAKAEEPPPTPKAKSEPSGPKEVKKTFTTKRAYEGDFRDEVKAELAKSGLYRDIENQEEAEQRADDFIAKVGIEAALDAARAGDVRGGARSVIIVRALEALDRDYLAAKTQERIAEVVAKQTELIQWRSQILLEQGREASMMQRMYATSDLGFKSEAKAEEWRKEFGEEPSEEMMAKWKERDKEFAELKEKLAEAEKRAEKAEAAATMKALQDSVARQKSINRKTTPAQRSKVLADKIRTLKIGQRGVMSATIVPPQVWDGAVEAVAQAMEATGKLATAIQAGLQKIRESDWYKKIQKDEQQDSEASFTSAVNEAMGDDVESGPIRIPKQMIREAVANGAKDIDSLVATIKEQLKEAYPDATDRQIRDAITEYGKVVNLNKDELSAEVRRIKRIGRIVSALEDVASQKRPLRSGLQRDKLDAEERALNKELREAMKDLPVDAEAQARELRTALDAAKTRARNRIEDLQREIDTKQRAPKSERNRQADAELDALIDERDRLQAIHDDVFGEKPMTPGERKIASLQDQLDRIRQRDFPEAKESPQYTEEDLAKMKSLRDEIQEARAKAGLIASKELPKSPLEIEIDGKIKAKEKAILDLTERLSRGDLSPKPKTNGNTSYELEQLRAEHEKLVQELKDRRKAQEVKMTPQERSVKRLQDQLDDLLAGRLKDKERIMREKSQEEKDLVDAIAKQKALMGMTEPVRSAEENRLISIDRAIAETERRINELDLEAKKGSPIETAAIREKQQTLAERRNELNRLREEAGLNVKKPPTAEERLKQIIDATRRSVEALDQKIRDKNVDPAKPQSVPETPELKALRQRREKLREEYRKLQEEAGVITRRKLDTAKKAAKVRIQELERRIDQGDFSKKEAKPPVTDNELIRLQAKKMRLKEQYDKEFYKHKLLSRTMPERVKDAAWEFWGLTRALRATGELSFVLMQGGALTVSNLWHKPGAVARAFKTMWQAMGSEKKSEEWLRKVKAQDWYPMAKEAKLAITEPHAELSAREELFMSDWMKIIWNVLGSPLKLKGDKAYKAWTAANPMRAIERGASAYLDTLRIERFMDGVEMLEKNTGAPPSKEELKDIADVANTLTGRATIGKLEPIASTLTKLFFSPRLWASAIKTATPYAFVHFGKMTPTARKMAMQDLGRYLGTTMGLVALAAAYLNHDDDDETGVETDPRSADFGKIKIGNKYIDPWGGRIQQLVFSTRMTIGLMSLIGEGMGEKPLPAYKDRKTGEITPLGQGMTPTMGETAIRMAQNKLAPSAGLLWEAMSTRVRKDGTRTSFGKEYDMSDELASNLYPIYWETVADLSKEDPGALEGFLAFYAFFGGGVNVDEPKVETGRQQRQQPQQRPQPPRR